MKHKSVNEKFDYSKNSTQRDVCIDFVFVNAMKFFLVSSFENFFAFFDLCILFDL